MNPKLRIGVLASGEGTTLQALLDACELRKLSAEVVIVISNNRESGALRRAQVAAIRTRHLSSATHGNADDLDRAMLAALYEARVDLVVLAGYLKKVGPRMLEAFAGKMVNTHPGLLPKFGGQGMYGRKVHEAVIAAKEKESGATVHLVDGEYDHGEILGQVRVPVMPGDTPDSLAERVQAAERPFLIQVLQQRFAK